MRAFLVLPGILILVLGGCSQDAPEATSASDGLVFRPVIDLHHTMELILEPAADVIWSSAGTIITAEGRQELAPTTEEGWHQVEQSAAVLAEAGNLLMLPGRAAGADWLEYSGGLVDAGTLALEAARAQDADALFDAGGRIYQVCLACHNQYWVEVDASDE